MVAANFSLQEVLKTAAFTPAEVAAVEKGEMVKGTLDSLSDRELAVKFAFQLQNVDLKVFEEAFLESTYKKDLDPTVLEVGHFISQQDDHGATSAEKAFETLTLEPNTEAALKLYRNAAPGDDLNLSQAEIDQFQKLGKDATRQQIEHVLRQQLLARYQSYRQHGLKQGGCPPYQRSYSKSYSAGDELQHKTALMKYVEQAVPELFAYILQYPAITTKPPGLVESFSWTNSAIDGLPTIALVHKIGYTAPTANSGGNALVLFQRMFYVSRSHNSVQGVGGCFPTTTDNNRHVAVYVTRTSTDKVAGFGGAAKRAMGARIMSSKQAENFERLQRLHGIQQQPNKK